mgnify:FL=1
MNFIKIFAVVLALVFAYAIYDACKPANEWLASVYVDGEYVGLCEVVPNGRCVKGDVLRDTVELNGVVQFEAIVLVSTIR